MCNTGRIYLYFQYLSILNTFVFQYLSFQSFHFQYFCAAYPCELGDIEQCVPAATLEGGCALTIVQYITTMVSEGARDVSLLRWMIMRPIEHEDQITEPQLMVAGLVKWSNTRESLRKLGKVAVIRYKT